MSLMLAQWSINRLCCIVGPSMSRLVPESVSRDSKPGLSGLEVDGHIQGIQVQIMDERNLP